VARRYHSNGRKGLVPESGEPFDIKKFWRRLHPEEDENRLKKKKKKV
jgi:hypothetical protein